MRNRTIAAGIVASVLLAAPQAALAQDTTDDLIVADTTMVSVFGTDISLAVAVDVDGNLTSVELTDGAGGAPEGAVATEVSPHEVKFVIDDNGTTIEVEVEDHKIETEVEARALTDLTGGHSWTGELFGAGNGSTDIAFTVTDNGGIPEIEITSITGLGAGTEVVNSYTETDDDEIEAKVKISLTDADGNRARITIEVEIEDEHGRTEAELKISARSDFFAGDDDDSRADDPTVNTPIDESYDDDDDYDDDYDDDSYDDDDDDYDDDYDDDSYDDDDDEDDDDDDDDDDDEDDD